MWPFCYHQTLKVQQFSIKQFWNLQLIDRKGKAHLFPIKLFYSLFNVFSLLQSPSFFRNLFLNIIIFIISLLRILFIKEKWLPLTCFFLIESFIFKISLQIRKTYQNSDQYFYLTTFDNLHVTVFPNLSLEEYS